MDQASQEKLAALVRSDVNALSDSDKEFIRARRSYLTEEQLAKFKTVLGDSSEAQAPQDSQDLESLPEKDLVKVAKKLGLKPSDYDSTEELIVAIREAQAAQ